MKNHYYKSIDQFLNQKYFELLIDKNNPELIKSSEELIKKLTIRDLRNRSKIFDNFIKYKIYDNWYNRIIFSKSENVNCLKRFESLYGSEIGKVLYDVSNIKRKNKTKQIKFIDLNHLLSQKSFRLYQDNLNDHCRQQLENIIKVFDKRYIMNTKKIVILKMLQYNVDGNWVDRLNNGDKFKKDGFSLEACIVKYGEIVGKQFFEERRISCAVTKEKYVKNHSEEEWNELCKSKHSNLGLDGYIEKYGEEDGTQRWNDYISSWKIGIEKRKQSGNWKNGQSLEEFQNKHGIEEGYKKWKRRIDRISYSQSLQGFIEKHGYELGNIKWTEYCKSNDKTSLKSFISRHGDVVGLEKYTSMMEKMGKCLRNSKNYSKISQDLFEFLSNILENKENIKYAMNNGEQYFYVNESFCKSMFVDFKYGNIVIEFFGDYWHANPAKYTENSILNHPNKNKRVAKDIWEIDRKRIEWLTNKGYNVLIIWEKEYRENKQETIDKCINYIKENYERTQLKS